MFFNEREELRIGWRCGKGRHNRNSKQIPAEVRKSFKKRKRNPVQIVKQNHNPEQADDFDVRCMGSDKTGQVKTG